MGERADLVLLLEAFDGLDNAAQRMLTALPSQMTEAAGRLDHERQAMRSVLQAVARARLDEKGE